MPSSETAPSKATLARSQFQAVSPAATASPARVRPASTPRRAPGRSRASRPAAGAAARRWLGPEAARGSSGVRDSSVGSARRRARPTAPPAPAADAGTGRGRRWRRPLEPAELVDPAGAATLLEHAGDEEEPADEQAVGDHVEHPALQALDVEGEHAEHDEPQVRH